MITDALWMIFLFFFKLQKTIKGGKSPQNKEKRFQFVINDTPGPGTYCQPPSLSPEDSKTKRQLKMPSARVWQHKNEYCCFFI